MVAQITQGEVFKRVGVVGSRSNQMTPERTTVKLPERVWRKIADFAQVDLSIKEWGKRRVVVAPRVLKKEPSNTAQKRSITYLLQSYKNSVLDESTRVSSGKLASKAALSARGSVEVHRKEEIDLLFQDDLNLTFIAEVKLCMDLSAQDLLTLMDRFSKRAAIKLYAHCITGSIEELLPLFVPDRGEKLNISCVKLNVKLIPAQELLAFIAQISKKTRIRLGFLSVRGSIEDLLPLFSLGIRERLIMDPHSTFHLTTRDFRNSRLLELKQNVDQISRSQLETQDSQERSPYYTEPSLPSIFCLSGNIHVSSKRQARFIADMNLASVKSLTLYGIDLKEVPLHHLYGLDRINLPSTLILTESQLDPLLRLLESWRFPLRKTSVKNIYIEPQLGPNKGSISKETCLGLKKELKKDTRIYLDCRRQLVRYPHLEELAAEGVNICIILSVEELRKNLSKDLEKFPSTQIYIDSEDVENFPLDELKTLKSEFQSVELVYPQGNEAIQSLIPKLIQVFQGKTENLLLAGNVAYLGSESFLSLYNANRGFREGVLRQKLFSHHLATAATEPLSHQLEKVDLEAFLDQWFFTPHADPFKPSFSPSDKKPLLHLIKEIIRGRAYPNLEELWDLNYKDLVYVCNFLTYEHFIEEFEKYR